MSEKHLFITIKKVGKDIEMTVDLLEFVKDLFCEEVRENTLRVIKKTGVWGMGNAVCGNRR